MLGNKYSNEPKFFLFLRYAMLISLTMRLEKIIVKLAPEIISIGWLGMHPAECLRTRKEQLKEKFLRFQCPVIKC